MRDGGKRLRMEFSNHGRLAWAGGEAQNENFRVGLKGLVSGQGSFVDRGGQANGWCWLGWVDGLFSEKKPWRVL